MFGIRKRRPPPFGGVHVDDDKDIQEHKPEEASRNDLWSEARLLLRDLAFALMIAVLVVVFIVQPVKVEGTSMLPRLHDGERKIGRASCRERALVMVCASGYGRM